MKIKRKALILFLCAAALVVSSVFGTMAYLTDTENATNTFTVGHVGLELDEAKVNENGQPINEENKIVATLSDAERVKENSYHLLPGHEYTKDPTVTVTDGSEDAYVRIMASITYQEDADQLFGQVNAPSSITKWINIDDMNWNINGDPKTTKFQDGQVAYITRTYEFRYKEMVKGNLKDGEGKKLEPLFTKITIPETLTNAQIKNLEGMKIDIVAHAIQADGFKDAAEAWKAFDDQTK